MSLLYRKELKETTELFQSNQVAPLTIGVDDSAIKDITTPIEFDVSFRKKGDPVNLAIIHWVKRNTVSYMKDLALKIKDDDLTLEAVQELGSTILLRPVQKDGVKGSGNSSILKEDKKIIVVIERDFVNDKDANEYSIVPRDLFEQLQQAL